MAVLKGRLQKADLTIDRLAERAGITRARCYKIFSGTATCTVSDFCAMCEALGITGSVVAAEAEQRLATEAAVSCVDDGSRPIATLTVFPGYGDDVAREDLPASYAALDLGVDPAVEAREVEARQ